MFEWFLRKCLRWINSTFTMSRYSAIDELTLFLFPRSKTCWRICVKLTIRTGCALTWRNRENRPIRNPSNAIWPSNQVRLKFEWIWFELYNDVVSLGQIWRISWPIPKMLRSWRLRGRNGTSKRDDRSDRNSSVTLNCRMKQPVLMVAILFSCRDKIGHLTARFR